VIATAAHAVNTIGLAVGLALWAVLAVGLLLAYAAKVNR
jgi:hypothetical protein